MLKKILLGFVIFLIVLAVVVQMQPADFNVTREATIDAPAELVFAQVNDFHKWEAWSPWAKLDPNAKITYEGSDSGPGAVFTWSGNNDVGAGRMTLEESVPNSLIRIKLDFLKPFEATNADVFKFEPVNGATKVIWNMSGKNGFLGKMFGLIMNCDKMIGADFEKGLAQLKGVVESTVQNPSALETSPSNN